jgi:hypothetical protein
MISKCPSGSDRYLFASIAGFGGIALVVIEKYHATCFVVQPLGILDACHDEAFAQTGSAFASACSFRSKKLNDRLSRFLRPFFQNPMASVVQHHNRDIGGYQLHLFGKFTA